MGPGANVLGTPIPLRLVLARTDQVAIAIVDAQAFATGLAFTLAVRLREAREWFDDPLVMNPGRRRGQTGMGLPPELLRLGVEFADGRKATSLDHAALRRETGGDPEMPVLMPRGGSGGANRWDLDMWLWPLPPQGPLAFVCEWPAQGIELMRAEIDAGVVLEAAERAETLWDDGTGEPGVTQSYIGF